MKNLLFSVMFLGCVSAILCSKAQSQNVRTYSIEPGTKFVATTNALDEISKFYIHLKNTTGKDLNLGWHKLSQDFPAGWDFSLCDYGTCYAGIPDGDFQMHPVEKDSSGFLAPNIYPADVTGTGTLVMVVWDIDHPNVSDTLTWIITASAQSGVHTTLINGSALRLYPNPSIDNITLTFGNTSSGDLRFVDVKGNTGLQIPVNEANSVEVDVSHLASGEYIILFSTKDGYTIHSKLIKN